MHVRVRVHVHVAWGRVGARTVPVAQLSTSQEPPARGGFFRVLTGPLKQLPHSDGGEFVIAPVCCVGVLGRAVGMCGCKPVYGDM